MTRYQVIGQQNR